MAYVCFSNNPVRWTLNCIGSVDGTTKNKIELSLFLIIDDSGFLK